MLRIQNQGRANAETATKVLSWVIFAQRPMTIEELRCAMAVEPKDTDLVEEALPDSDSLLSVCCGLVVVDGDSNIVRFVHYTTLEYFERTGPAYFPCVHTYLTEVCITYLSFKTFSNWPFDEPLNGKTQETKYYDPSGQVWKWLWENIFLGYAAQHWENHARKALSQDSTVNEMVVVFLGRKANVSYSTAVAFVCEDFSYRYGANIPSSDFTDLHVAATFGLQELTQKLLERGANVNVRDSNGWTALHGASNRGHINVIQVLLDEGANIKAKCRQGYDALCWAAVAGRERTVQLLLRQGTALESITDAISKAASKGHSGVVHILLESLSDIEARRSCLGLAIQSASKNDQEGLIRLLLEEGTNLQTEMIHHYAGPALAIASHNDSKAVMKLLLEYGVDVNGAGVHGKIPLHEAVERGSVEGAKLLLDNGANIEAADQYGARALHQAMDRNRPSKKIVLLLLERGANVNAYAYAYWGGHEPALMIAAKRGHTDFIPYLLEYGADTSARDEQSGRTSLELAVLEGHVGVVRMLLTSECSATMQEGLLTLTQLYRAMKPPFLPDEEDIEGGPIKDTSQLILKLKALQPEDFRKCLLLHHPAAKGDETITRSLLNMGANVEAISSQGDVALYRAAKNGQTGIVRILLDHGANIEAVSFDAATPLAIAVRYGESAAAMLLIDRGANIEHEANNNGTTLTMAVWYGKQAMIRLLLDSGANPNATSVTYCGGTALHVAASSRDYGTVSDPDSTRLLVSRGANVESKDSQGQTPLVLAVRYGRVNMVKLLLELEADCTAVPDTVKPWNAKIYEVGFSTAVQLVREAKQKRVEMISDNSYSE